MNFLLGIEHLPTLENAKLIAFDCETTALQPKHLGLRLLQLQAPGTLPVVIDCWQLSDKEWDQLEAFFTVEREWVAHNAVFDLGWLQEHGIYPAGDVKCTMLASRVLTNGMPNVKHGLQQVVKRYLKEDISKEEQASDWSGQLRPEQLEYAAKDVDLLLRLLPLLKHRLADGMLMGAWLLECKALPAMAQLWRTGLPFSAEALQKLLQDLKADHVRLGAEFIEMLDAELPEGRKLPRDPDGSYNLRAKAEGSVRAGTKVAAGFNLNSPKQLLDVFTLLIGEVPKDANGKPSASKQSLKEYVGDSPVIGKYLEWKRVEKRRQMAEALIKHQWPDGFVRASYLQLGADTGRMSCMSPNLQQVPRDQRFRACVIAPAGWRLIDADYSQMELRLAARESRDPLMTEAFQQKQDLHTITAKAIYNVDDGGVTKDMRQVSKSANFGLLYGSGAKGLRNYAASSGIRMSLDEAAEIREKFHAAYKGISKWQQQAASAANRAEPNASVRIRVSGLRRFLPGEQNKLTTRCNTPIQGAGAAVMKRALGMLWPHLREAGEGIVRIAGVVHDEVILLVHKEYAEEWAQKLTAVMEKAEAQWLDDIPAMAEAKIGESWDACK